jgi:hypothetical protein
MREPAFLLRQRLAPAVVSKGIAPETYNLALFAAGMVKAMENEAFFCL